jgi:hypothetical protein
MNQAGNRCDVNGDNAINQADLDIIVQAASMGSTNSAYDLNRDGRVDVSDVQTASNAIMNPASCPP